MAARMLERQGFGGALDRHRRPRRARSTGADFVLAPDPGRRPGGAARATRPIPLACGCIGQETTGAGGFAKAMRTVPVVLEIAERVRELAAPDAWIVDFTNPVGIVTRALLDAGHRAIGLCNVAIGVPARDRAAARASRPSGSLVDHVGLNHLTWVRARAGRRATTCCPSCSPSTATSSRAARRPPAAAARGARRDPVVLPPLLLRPRRRPRRAARRRPAGGRGRARSSARLLEHLPRRRGLARSRRCSSSAAARSTARPRRRSSPRSSADTGDVQVVDVRERRDASRASPTTTSSRCPRGSARTGAEPLPQAPLAPELLGLVQHVAAYERLAAEAAVTRDPVDRPEGAARASADRPGRARRDAPRARSRPTSLVAAAGAR